MATESTEDGNGAVEPPDKALSNISLAFVAEGAVHFTLPPPDGSTFDERVRRYRDSATGRYVLPPTPFPKVEIARQADVYFAFDRTDFYRDKRR